MEESSTSGNHKLEGKREEEDVWSDLHALKRLYGLLQQSTSVADRVEPQESIVKLDKKSTLLLKKLLDDATQQAIQSQAKSLFNPSAINKNSGVKPTEPPTVVTTPEDRVAVEFQHLYDCPNQINPVLPMNSLGLNINPQTTPQIKSNIAGSEFGKETPVDQDSMNLLTKKEPSEEQSSRARDHPKPNDLSFVKKQRDHKLVNKQFPSPSKMAPQRSTTMSTNQFVVSGNHYKRTRVESKTGTPLKLDKLMAADVSSSQPDRKSQTEKDREVNNDINKPVPLDSKSTVPITTNLNKDSVDLKNLNKDSVDLKKDRRESVARKKTAQNRKLTAQIESGKGKKSVDLTPKRRQKDQISRTIRRPTIDSKQRGRSRSSTVNPNRNRAVTKMPSQLTVTRRIKPQSERPSATSLSKSSCSRSSCSSSSSPSIISNGIIKTRMSRRIPDRRVAIYPRSIRRASPITSRRSFGSRRSPTRLASLPKQSKLLMCKEQNNGNINVKKTTKEGKLRRIKNKLSVIFHHHHHHHYHHDKNSGDIKEGYPQDDKQHRSLWKYIRGKKDDHYNHKGKEVEIYAEKAVVREGKQNQHGYFHMLLDGLIRHLWHTRERKKRKNQNQKQKRFVMRGDSVVGGRLKVKKLHWWQKWKKSGGVKLNGRKNKPLLKLGRGRKIDSTKKR